MKLETKQRATHTGWPVSDDFWLYRVQLTDTQAIIGNPNFLTISIGFAHEPGRLDVHAPYTMAAEEIYDHISVNKGDDMITRKDCLAAIQLIQTGARTTRHLWQGLWDDLLEGPAPCAARALTVTPPHRHTEEKEHTVSKNDLVREIRDRLASLDPSNLDASQARPTILALRQLAENNQHESTSALALADLIESTLAEPASLDPERADPRSATLRSGKDWVEINAQLPDGRRVRLTGMVARLHEAVGRAPRHKVHTGIELYEAALRVTEAVASAEQCT